MKEEIQKFIPYGRQSINEDDIASVVEVLKVLFNSRPNIN